MEGAERKGKERIGNEKGGENRIELREERREEKQFEDAMSSGVAKFSNENL